MGRLVLALAVAAAFTQPLGAQDQEGENYCAHLQSEIAIRQQSLAGLSNLVNTSAYTLMECKINPDNPFTYERDECLSNPMAQGFWNDQETRTFYVVYSKQYIQEYAQNIGASSSDVQRSFAASDQVANKIRYGGVIDSLRAEIADWQAEYARSCAGSIEPPQPAPPVNNGCLLGVCPESAPTSN